jgi:hypothetical protein
LEHHNPGNALAAAIGGRKEGEARLESRGGLASGQAFVGLGRAGAATDRDGVNQTPPEQIRHELISRDR